MAIPVVSVRYTQRSTLDWSEVVTCRHCGHVAKASVVATGVDSGRAAYGIGRDAARERAGVGAFGAAVDNAKAQLNLARCPRCQKRSGSLAWLGIKVALAWTLLSVPVYGMIWAALGGQEASTGSLRSAGFVLFVLAVGLAALSYKAKLKGVDRRVRFEPVILVPEDVKGPLAPPPPVRTSAADEAARRAQTHDASEGPAPESGLELDIDRKWNQRK